MPGWEEGLSCCPAGLGGGSWTLLEELAGPGSLASLLPLPCQELLRDHRLLEPASRPRDSYARQSRHRERRELHRLKREHERREGPRRKVLRLPEVAGEASSSSGGEGDARDSLDIQVRAMPWSRGRGCWEARAALLCSALPCSALLCSALPE